MIVKNRMELETARLNEQQLELRKIALDALELAIKSVKPQKLIKDSVKIHEDKLIIQNDVYDLKDFEKVYIIGAGKATAEMAFALEKLLKKSRDIEIEGVINIPENLDIRSLISKSNVKINYASHPIPNENGLKGSKLMMDLIVNSTNSDLFFCLISGGGSALLPFPKNGVTLNDLKRVNELLLASGVSIHEINAIRKHLSDIKGGNLVRKLNDSSQAKLISLIISDVVGDNFDAIASGPTVPDLTTFNDAVEILRKYGLYEKIPKGAKNTLEKGLSMKEMENPKPSDKCFNNVNNYLIGSVSSAAREVTAYLKKHNFKVDYFSNEIVGEARDFGIKLHQIINQKINDYEDYDKILLIGTGELTVTIKGRGIGGRNQEMLLGFLDFIKDKEIDYNLLIISANLDGIEGNSNAMGALIDNFTISQMLEKSVNLKKYLENNDSNSFFKKANSEIISGPTGCNVNDLLIVLVVKEGIEK